MEFNSSNVHTKSGRFIMSRSKSSNLLRNNRGEARGIRQEKWKNESILSMGNKRWYFLWVSQKGLCIISRLAHYLFCMCYTMMNGECIFCVHDAIAFALLLVFVLFVRRSPSSRAYSSSFFIMSFHMHPSFHLTSIVLKFKRFKCAALTNMCSQFTYMVIGEGY